MNPITRLVRALTAWAWADELRRLRGELTYAKAHIRSMQTMLEGPHDMDPLHEEIARLRRLLRAMRETCQRMRGRRGLGTDINWPHLP
jgi:hypothetical protein